MSPTSARVGLLAVMMTAVAAGCAGIPLESRPGAKTSSSGSVQPDAAASGAGPSMDVRSVLARDEWVVAVGDIAECSGTGDEATSALVSTMSLATVLALGDLAYPDGTSQDFECFNASWGRHKGRIRPVPGNHEYRTTDAAGYFGYFGAAAGDPSKGYYSWDDGYWHFIALNSNCKEIGGCEAGSPQEQWLRADLKAHPGHACTLAFMHHPRFSSGSHGPQAEVDALWRALYEARVDIVLSGHDHSYERFAPQTPDGVQVVDGIRQFVVGTGGASLRPFGKPEPNSVFRQSTADGALRLHLGASSYAWAFLTAPSGAATDTGSFPCATP